MGTLSRPGMDEWRRRVRSAGRHPIVETMALSFNVAGVWTGGKGTSGSAVCQSVVILTTEVAVYCQKLRDHPLYNETYGRQNGASLGGKRDE